MFKKFFLLFLTLTLLTLGLRCTTPSQKTAAPVTLRYWGVWDDNSNLIDLINAYKALHPNVTIEYHKLRYEEYEQALLEAWAEDRGPDIFSIHNTWVKKYQSKIEPLPAQTTVNYQITKKTWFKTDTYVETRTAASLTPQQIKNKFVPVVYGDVYASGKLWGLPLSVDTLVMYANRDLLNAAGVALPPSNWLDFQKAVSKITKKDKNDNIVVAGAALGAGQNVTRSLDIVSLLMLQNGARMANEAGVPTFNTIPPELKGRTESPGEGALTFYTDFANPTKEVYSWNLQMPNSLDTFMASKAGFFFGYAYQLPLIKTQAPGLNLTINPVPQVNADYPINFANYWLETVAKKTKNVDWAWDFLQFATKAEVVKNYLDKTKKPTALISLIDQQKQNFDLQPFASSLLTAKSWYHGREANLAETYFTEMIDSVVKKQQTIIQALNLGVNKISQTIP